MDRDAVASDPIASPSAATARQDTNPSRATTDRRLLIVLCLASFLAVVNFAAPPPSFPRSPATSGRPSPSSVR